MVTADRSGAGRRTTLGVLFLTLWLDLVGFSIVLPMYADMIAWYGDRDDGILGAFLAVLGSWWPVADAGQRFALVGAGLMAIYSLLQFVAAPLWGRLSDRIGRRPVLLITVFGNLLGYVLWIFAIEFLLLLLARVVNGVMAGNLSAATAAGADISDPERRAATMGVIGAAFGLGFVCGPVIGLVGYEFCRDATWWPANLHPFAGPAALAALLSLVNLVWIARRFAETLPVERRGRARGRGWNPWRIIAAVGSRRVVAIAAAYLIYLCVFGAFEATIVFLGTDVVGFGVAGNGALLATVALVMAAVQGGLVRRLSGQVSERRMALLGLAVLAAGLVAIAAAARRVSPAALFLAAGLAAIGAGFLMPSLMAWASRLVPPQHQGEAMGAMRSLGALARILGPLGGGACYYFLGPFAPYLAGCALCAVPALLVWRLGEDAGG